MPILAPPRAGSPSSAMPPNLKGGMPRRGWSGGGNCGGGTAQD